MGLFDFQSRKERRAAHEAHAQELATVQRRYESANERCVALARERDAAQVKARELQQRVEDLEHAYRLAANGPVSQAYEAAFRDVAAHCNVFSGLHSTHTPATIAELIKRSYDAQRGNEREVQQANNARRRVQSDLDQARLRVAHAERLLKEIAAHARTWDLPAFADLVDNVLRALGGEGAAVETKTLRQLAIGTMERLTKRERKKVISACGM